MRTIDAKLRGRSGSAGGGPRGKRRRCRQARRRRSATGGIPTEPSGGESRRMRRRRLDARPGSRTPAPDPLVHVQTAPESGAVSRTHHPQKADGRRIRARRQMFICGAREDKSGDLLRTERTVAPESGADLLEHGTPHAVSKSFARISISRSRHDQN